MKCEVEIHSTDPSAVDAVRHTLDQLPGGPALLIEESGKFFLVGDDFVMWACERQGYVKKVHRTPPEQKD